ncbi:hypothetical protein [Vibrio sp. Vb1980]|nr:hypothetical protein [Vibrio sp. Vb1980]MDW1974594.1 hypothetical protein [Vibrio sp. Vb1980]
MAQVAQMTKKDVGYMLATVSLNQPLHPEVRPYMLLKSMKLNQEASI